MAKIERFFASDKDLNRTICNGNIANITPFLPSGAGWGALYGSEAGNAVAADEESQIFGFALTEGARVLRIDSLDEADALITRDRTSNLRVDFEALRADYDAILYVPEDAQGLSDEGWGWDYGQLCILNPDVVPMMPDAEGMDVAKDEGQGVTKATDAALKTDRQDLPDMKTDDPAADDAKPSERDADVLDNESSMAEVSAGGKPPEEDAVNPEEDAVNPEGNAASSEEDPKGVEDASGFYMPEQRSPEALRAEEEYGQMLTEHLQEMEVAAGIPAEEIYSSTEPHEDTELPSEAEVDGEASEQDAASESMDTDEIIDEPDEDPAPGWDTGSSPRQFVQDLRHKDDSPEVLVLAKLTQHGFLPAPLIAGNDLSIPGLALTPELLDACRTFSPIEGDQPVDPTFGRANGYVSGDSEMTVRKVSVEDLRDLVKPREWDAFNEAYDTDRIYVSIETKSQANPVVVGPCADGTEREGHAMNRFALYFFRKGSDQVVPQIAPGYADSSGRIVKWMYDLSFPTIDYLRDFGVRRAPNGIIIDGSPHKALAEDGAFDMPLPHKAFADVVRASRLELSREQSSLNKCLSDTRDTVVEMRQNVDMAKMAKNAISVTLADRIVAAKSSVSELDRAIRHPAEVSVPEASMDAVKAMTAYMKDLSAFGGRDAIRAIYNALEGKTASANDITSRYNDAAVQYEELYKNGGVMDRGDKNSAIHAANLFGHGDRAVMRPEPRDVAALLPKGFQATEALNAAIKRAVRVGVDKYNAGVTVQGPEYERHLLYAEGGKVYTYYGTQAHTPDYYRGLTPDGIVSRLMSEYRPSMDKSRPQGMLGKGHEQEATARMRGLLTKPAYEELGTTYDGRPLGPSLTLADMLSRDMTAFMDNHARGGDFDWLGQDDRHCGAILVPDNDPMDAPLNNAMQALAEGQKEDVVAGNLAHDCMDAIAGDIDREAANDLSEQMGAVPDQRMPVSMEKKSRDEAADRVSARSYDTHPLLYGSLNRNRTVGVAVDPKKQQELRIEARKEAIDEGLSGTALENRVRELYTAKIEETKARLESSLSTARWAEDRLRGMEMPSMEQRRHAGCVWLKYVHTVAVHQYERDGGLVGPAAAVTSGCGNIAVAQASFDFRGISFAETIRMYTMSRLAMRREGAEAVERARPGLRAAAEADGSAQGLSGTDLEMFVRNRVDAGEQEIRARYSPQDSRFGAVWDGLMYGFGIRTQIGQGQGLKGDIQALVGKQGDGVLDTKPLMWRLGAGAAIELTLAFVAPGLALFSIVGNLAYGVISGILADMTVQRIERRADRGMEKVIGSGVDLKPPVRPGTDPANAGTSVLDTVERKLAEPDSVERKSPQLESLEKADPQPEVVEKKDPQPEVVEKKDPQLDGVGKEDLQQEGVEKNDQQLESVEKEAPQSENGATIDTRPEGSDRTDIQPEVSEDLDIRPKGEGAIDTRPEGVDETSENLNNVEPKETQPSNGIEAGEQGDTVDTQQETDEKDGAAVQAEAASDVAEAKSVRDPDLDNSAAAEVQEIAQGQAASASDVSDSADRSSAVAAHATDTNGNKAISGDPVEPKAHETAQDRVKASSYRRQEVVSQVADYLHGDFSDKEGIEQLLTDYFTFLQAESVTTGDLTGLVSEALREAYPEVIPQEPVGQALELVCDVSSGTLVSRDSPQEIVDAFSRNVPELGDVSEAVEGYIEPPVSQNPMAGEGVAPGVMETIKADAPEQIDQDISQIIDKGNDAINTIVDIGTAIADETLRIAGIDKSELMERDPDNAFYSYCIGEAASDAAKGIDISTPEYVTDMGETLAALYFSPEDASDSVEAVPNGSDALQVNGGNGSQTVRMEESPFVEPQPQVNDRRDLESSPEQLRQNDVHGILTEHSGGSTEQEAARIQQYPDTSDAAKGIDIRTPENATGMGENLADHHFRPEGANGLVEAVQMGTDALQANDGSGSQAVRMDEPPFVEQRTQADERRDLDVSPEQPCQDNMNSVSPEHGSNRLGQEIVRIQQDPGTSVDGDATEQVEEPVEEFDALAKDLVVSAID